MDKDLQRLSNSMRRSQMFSDPVDFGYDPTTGMFAEVHGDRPVEGIVVTEMTKGAEGGWG